MRRMVSGRFKCAMGGWSAAQVIPTLRLQVRRYGHDRTLFAISVAGNVALLVNGQRPGADGNSHPVGAHSATRSPGAGVDPDSTPTRHPAFHESIRPVSREYSP